MKELFRNFLNGAVLLGIFWVGVSILSGIVAGGIMLFTSDMAWYYKLLAVSPVIFAACVILGKHWRNDFGCDVWSR